MTPAIQASIDHHRRRYEALRDAGIEVAAALPLTPRDAPPPGPILHEETIPGGWYASAILHPGDRLRLVDTNGTGAAALLAWALHDPSERLNPSDTLKIQWSAELRRGRVLFSDMGRVMLSITEDTSAAHDALMGGSTAASTLAQYGPGPYRNTRDNFILAALKMGLARQDIATCITCFAPVSVAPDGRFTWQDAKRQPGGLIAFRAEMPLRIALCTAPHPADPALAYSPGPHRLPRSPPWLRKHGSLAMSTFDGSPDRRGPALRLDVEIPARQPWSGLVRRGETLRLIDTHGQQAIDTLFYNAADYAERYSAQDTVRAQGSAYIIGGTQILSNEGRVMMIKTLDPCGRHDTAAGACSCESNAVRFGHETRFLHACRDNFCAELSRYGMTKRDMVPNLNFIMNVPIAPDSKLVVDDGISAPGTAIELVAEMDVLCVISNCPQVNNPCKGYHPTPVRVQIVGV